MKENNGPKQNLNFQKIKVLIPNDKRSSLLLTVMMDWQRSPLPLTMFSANSSLTMMPMLGLLTLLMRPLMDFLSASQAKRWNAGDAVR